MHFYQLCKLFEQLTAVTDSLRQQQ